MKLMKSINTMYHINRIKHSNHMIMTIEAENIFDKIQHPFIKELLDKQGRNHLNIKKTMYEKPTANVFCRKRQRVFSLRARRQGCPLSPLLFNSVLKGLGRAIRQKKKKKKGRK